MRGQTGGLRKSVRVCVLGGFGGAPEPYASLNLWTSHSVKQGPLPSLIPAIYNNLSVCLSACVRAEQGGWLFVPSVPAG